MSIKNTSNTKSVNIRSFDIVNDSLKTYLNKPCIVVLLKEPSCTGCKENLAKYLSNHYKEYHQIGLISSYNSIVHRKIYQNYFKHKFKRASQILYSLDEENAKFYIGDSLYSMQIKSNPQVFVIKKNGTSTHLFSYDDIFEEIFVRKSFKEYLKKYLKE